MIKLLIFIITLLTTVNHIKSQVQAITEFGDTIYVFDNGKWSFQSDEIDEQEDVNELAFLEKEVSIDTSDQKFVVPTDSKSNVTSRLKFFDINFDAKKWNRIPPGELNDEAELAFKSNNGEIFCIVISEEIKLSKEAIYKVALNNMEKFTGSEPKVYLSELRNVNGANILRCRFSVDFNGLDMIFDSHYFSNEYGTIQFTTWTGENIYEKYRKTIDDMLNGIVIKK